MRSKKTINIKVDDYVLTINKELYDDFDMVCEVCDMDVKEEVRRLLSHMLNDGCEVEYFEDFKGDIYDVL